MAKIFLDTNILINLVEKRNETVNPSNLQEHIIFISPLSVHVLIYVTKHKIPYPKLTEIIELFSLVAFDEAIIYKALTGPTNDFEDNTQLHCAAEAECDLFLTEDKGLRTLKFFGKTKIISPLQLPPNTNDPTLKKEKPVGIG